MENKNLLILSSLITTVYHQHVITGGGIATLLLKIGLKKELKKRCNENIKLIDYRCYLAQVLRNFVYTLNPTLSIALFAALNKV